MRRGAFVGSLAVAAAADALAGCAKPPAAPAATAPLDRPVAEPRAPAGPHELIKPPRLRPGDIIGIVTPAGPVLHEIELDHARAQAHLLGLEPRFGAHITEQYGYLAGSDGHRAEDFNRFARDPDVRAIFALRGGYGTMRILGDIDYDALADDPKVVLGFSDLTALLNAITSRTGLVTFHGPVAGHSRLSAVLLDGIRRAVMSREPLGVMHAPRSASLAGGTARGRLTGGNLSVLCALVGTPYAVPHAGRLMILEDVHEAPYRVDRMLTQLRLSGELSRVAGIVLGRFDDCIPKADDLPSLTIAQTLRDRLADLGKPVLTGAQIGHLEDQWTLPLGVTAAVDATRGHLEIEESGVA